MILSTSSTVSLLLILLMPFHAFLTVWLASIFGHYTAFRLWKEVLLVLGGLGAVYLLAFDQKIRSHTLTRLLMWLILAYTLVNVVWGFVGLHEGTVTAKALGYGLIVNLRFLAFFLITWACAVRLARLRVHWQWVVLWPAIIVILFGLFQIFVLPHNFLTHFGYGPDTIAPYGTINHNEHYVRFASFLRGANPLGAYLIIPLTLLAILIARGKRRRIYGTILAGGFIVLFFTFSRSAWVGALLSIGTVLFLGLKSRRAQQYMLIGAAAVVLIGTGVTLAFHHQAGYQNFVYHTEDHSKIKTTSDQGHWHAMDEGAQQVVHNPLGRGPGTAGPASVYNGNHGVRLAENYYIQIGQETGWLGMVLFLLITVGVASLLWVRRAHPLALSLFASLLGLLIVNFLSHAWTDDTLAYVWWGLAGIAMAPGLNPEE